MFKTSAKLANKIKRQYQEVEGQINSLQKKQSNLSNLSAKLDETCSVSQREMSKLVEFDEVKRYAQILYVKVKQELENVKDGKPSAFLTAISGSPVPVYEEREEAKEETLLLKQKINNLKEQLQNVEEVNLDGADIEKDFVDLKNYRNVKIYDAMYSQFEKASKDAYKAEQQLKQIEKEFDAVNKLKQKYETKLEKVETKLADNDKQF